MNARTFCGIIAVILGGIGGYLVDDLRLFFGIFIMMWANNISMIHKRK